MWSPPLKLPVNEFKRAPQEGKLHLGLWLGLAHTLVAELLASAGADWLLIDGEHAPNSVSTTLAQLQAISGYRTQAVVRPLSADPALIKQMLDIGAQTLLVPMVDNESQAKEVVRAMRYPRRASVVLAARWRARPAGTVSPTIAGRLKKNFACSCRPNRFRPWRRWRPLPTSTEWTVSSSARPICPRRWACSGNQGTPTSALPSNKESAVSVGSAMRRACWRPMLGWPGTTCRQAPPLLPSALTRACSAVRLARLWRRFARVDRRLTRTPTRPRVAPIDAVPVTTQTSWLHQS